MSTNPSGQSIFSKEVHPYKQLIFCLIVLAASMTLIRLTGVASAPEDGVMYWEACLVVMLAYALFNSIFSLSYPNKNVYFRDSIFTFMAIAGLGGFLAYLFSGMSIDEAGSFRWLYFVFGFSYLVIMSIVNLMRKIIEIAKKQDARLRGEE